MNKYSYVYTVGKWTILIRKDNDNNATVRFYDNRQEGFDLLGQFVASYYIDTIINDVKNDDLMLYSDIPGWIVNKEEIKLIKEYCTLVKKTINLKECD